MTLKKLKKANTKLGNQKAILEQEIPQKLVFQWSFLLQMLLESSILGILLIILFKI